MACLRYVIAGEIARVRTNNGGSGATYANLAHLLELSAAQARRQLHASDELKVPPGLTWWMTAAKSRSELRSTKLIATASSNASQTRLQGSATVRNPGKAAPGAQPTVETPGRNSPRALGPPAARSDVPNVERITAGGRRILTSTNAFRKRW